MTRAERVALILHDVFHYSFAEVAEIVGRTPAACHQPASSARHRIRASQAPATSPTRQVGIISAGLRPIEGGEQIARYIVGIAGKAPDLTIVDGGTTAVGPPETLRRPTPASPGRASPGALRPSGCRPWRVNAVRTAASTQPFPDEPAN